MRAILKQCLYLAAAVTVLYAALLGISYAVLPPQILTGGLDSNRAAATIFMTEPKYVFLNRAAQRPQAPRIVLVGASNMVVGLKQRELQPLLPDDEVDNLSVGGSNMTQVAQVVDLVQQLQDAAARRHTTFVIGTWYGMYVEDRFRWNTPDRHAGDTDIDIERYRYGFYRRSASGPQTILPAADLSLGVALIHPYLLLDKLSRTANHLLANPLLGGEPVRTDAQRDATVLSEREKEDALNYWRGQIRTDGTLSEEQFAILQNLIDRILADGSRVALLELPIPRWHAQRSPFQASYLQHRNRLLATLSGKPGFSYLQMAVDDDDLDFSDEVHPKPGVTPRWAASVATLLHAAGDRAPQPALVWNAVDAGSAAVAGTRP